MKIPEKPPDHARLLARLKPERFRALISAGTQARTDHYRHWDRLRHLTPPGDLSLEEWWLSVKLARAMNARELPFTDAGGKRFRYCLPDAALAMLHDIDGRASGEIAISEQVTNPLTSRHYIVHSLIEEAITSSQLEGASSTRRVAKEMLQTGRAPRDRSERMIVNNFRGMGYVQEHRTDPLSLDFILELQHIVTEGTLDDPKAAGRLQRPNEERVEVRDEKGALLHRPPPAEQLPARVAALCDFANATGRADGFVHPVVRAILVHFWLAYDHPFLDGNGRTSRALFYWSMLHQRYWLAEYLSISRLLRLAPARYARSFLYVETDELDVTYFILFQLKVICRAIDELHMYLERKMEEVRRVESLVRRSRGLNHRQLALISHALRHPGAEYTYRSHARSHRVVRQSARTDLLRLASRGLLTKKRVGREVIFASASDLAGRLSGESRGKRLRTLARRSLLPRRADSPAD